MVFMLDGDTLYTSGDLVEVVLDMAFEVEIARLLDTEFSEISLDLRLANAITSPYIGQIIACAQRATERGKRLRIIASGNVTALLRAAGLHKKSQLASPQAGSRNDQSDETRINEPDRSGKLD